MYSLSRALSVRFASTMLVGLLIVGTSLLFTAKRILRGELDRGLRAALELESAALAAGQPLAPINEWPAREAFTQNVNRFVVVRDTVGNIVFGNTYGVRTLPFDSSALRAAARGERRWISGEWNGSGVRSVYAPAPDNKVLQVSALLGPSEGVFVLLFGIMVGTVVLTTGASAVGARWLARSASAPVAAITTQINEIDNLTTADGITAHADAEEYRELVAVINDMLQRLRHASAIQRQIIANAGHDIRTPITVIQGQIEVALRTQRSPEYYRHALMSCLDEARHLASISEKMMLLARIETGAIATTRRFVDVAQLVYRSVESLPTPTVPHRIVIDDVRAGAAAMADEFLVSLAFREILDNAVRHTPPDTRVSVAVAMTDAWVCVTVDDAGPGVPDEHLSLLFERTHREDAARTRSGGAGLGLAIVAAVVRMHEGWVDAEQSPLGGLRLTLKLPAATARSRSKGSFT